MKSSLVFLVASGLVSALSGPAPTAVPAKRQFGVNGLGGFNNADLLDLADELGLDLGADNILDLSIGQLNCDILQLLALMGLNGAVDVVGLGLNFNQQITMLIALEQLAQFQTLGLINQNDIFDLISSSLIGNLNPLGGFLGNGFNLGVFKRGFEDLIKEKRIPADLPTPTSILKARGHGRKRQEECTIALGTTTETTSFSEATETEEATATEEEEATATEDAEEAEETGEDEEAEDEEEEEEEVDEEEEADEEEETVEEEEGTESSEVETDGTVGAEG